MKEKVKEFIVESFVRTSESFIDKTMDGKASQSCAGFTTKNGGVSKGHFSSMNPAFHVRMIAGDVVSKQRILAERIHVPAERMVGAEQTHETNIVKITSRACGIGALDYVTLP